VNHDQLKAALTRPDFLRELHHLLWVEPHDNRGLWDEGWNCRDHALVTAALAQLFGFTAVVGYGQATFVQGPSGELPPVGMELNIHAWTMVEQGGMYDLSPRLAQNKFPGWRPSSVIAQSSCEPAVGTKFSYLLEADHYQNTIARATHDQGCLHVVFWGQESNNLSRVVLGDSLNFCNSPLTDQLRAQFGEKGDLHAKAVLHLWEFLKGEAASLTPLSQGDAWSKIGDRKGDAVYRVCSRGRIA
jgi:hypothetical protein